MGKLKLTALTQAHLQQIKAIIVVVVVASGRGFYLLATGHAASLYVSTEAESGTLAGGATVQTDTNASNGEYVQFGSVPSGNGTWTPMVGANAGIGYPCDSNDAANNFASTYLPGRTGGLDIYGDVGTADDTWYHISNPTPWASERNASGGNSNIRGDLEFLQAGSNRAVDYTVGMLPINDTPPCPQDPYSSATSYNDDRTCMQDGANGQFNSYWVALSQDLTNFFQTENGVSTSRVIIRTGWECYGNWYPWSEYVAGGPTYAEYFRQIVTSMRSVSGANFKFSWNCGTGVDAGDSTHPNTDTSDAAYPGDAYVDYLDFDAYDVPNFVSTVINGNHGLAWWVNFAAQHGKYLAFSEWGEQDETGDDPAYIQTMYNFFYNPANRVAYADYHNLQPNGLVNFPNSAAMYTSLFKGTPQRYVANRVVENLAKIRNVT